MTEEEKRHTGTRSSGSERRVEESWLDEDGALSEGRVPGKDGRQMNAHFVGAGTTC